MILFFAEPQNFVILSFMDKPPTPILMRWIFGPPGRGNNIYPGTTDTGSVPNLSILEF